MSFKKQMSTTFRKSLLIGIPVATVVGFTALAYAVPNIFSSGQGLSSTTMNANFAALENEVSGGSGGVSNLNAQIASLSSTVNALQAQVNALPAPPAPALTYDWATTGSSPVVAGFNIAPAAGQNCTVVVACQMPANIIGNSTQLEIDLNDVTEGSGFGGICFALQVPGATSSYSSAANTCIFTGNGDEYQVQANITNEVAFDNGQVRCNFTVTCG